MATKTITVNIADFNLVSRYTCTANLDSDGSDISIQTSTPTTNTKNKLFSYALPPDATNVSGVLTATFSDGSFSAKKLTVNGVSVNDNGTRTVNIPISASSRYVQIPFVYQCRAVAHDTHVDIVHQHQSTVTVSNIKLVITYNSEQEAVSLLEKTGTVSIPYTDGNDNQIWLKGTSADSEVWNFTVSGIPSGAVVTKATLSFASGNTYNTPGYVYIYWGTGTSPTVWSKSGTPAGKSYSVDLTARIGGNGSYSLNFRKTANSDSSQSNVYFTGIKLTVEYTYWVGAPTPPTSIKINNAASIYAAENQTATLSWSGASGGEGASIYSYHFYVDGNFYGERPADTTSIPIPTYAGGMHEWTIKVLTTLGDYSSFATNTAICYTYTNPTAPTEVILSRTTAEPSGAAMLSWNGAQDGFYNEVVSYKVYKDGVLFQTVNADELSITAPATKNAANTYTVQAVGSHGEASTISTTSAKLTCYYTTPSIPKATSETTFSVDTNATITLTWNKSSNGTNNPLTGYEVYKNNVLVDSLPATATSYQVQAAAAEGVSDTYEIRAIGTYENSEGTDFIIATLVIPLGITTINITRPYFFNINDTVSVYWEHAASAPKNPFKSYQIYEQTSADGLTWGAESFVKETTDNIYTFVAADNNYRRLKIYVLGAANEELSKAIISPSVKMINSNFTDAVLTVGDTRIKAIHMTELQDIALVGQLNITNTIPTFTQIVPGITPLSDWTNHVMEIRNSIDKFNDCHLDWTPIIENCPTAAIIEELRQTLLYNRQKEMILDAEELLLDNCILTYQEEV